MSYTGRNKGKTFQIWQLMFILGLGLLAGGCGQDLSPGLPSSLSPGEEPEGTAKPLKKLLSEEEKHERAVKRAKALAELFPQESDAIVTSLGKWVVPGASHNKERHEIYGSLQQYKKIHAALPLQQSKATANNGTQEIFQKQYKIIKETLRLGLEKLSSAAGEIEQWDESSRLAGLLGTNRLCLVLAQWAISSSKKPVPINYLYEAFSGKNLLTHQDLSGKERSQAMAEMISYGTTQAKVKLDAATSLLVDLKDSLRTKYGNQKICLDKGFRAASLEGAKIAKALIAKQVQITNQMGE